MEVPATYQKGGLAIWDSLMDLISMVVEVSFSS